jgi:CheY-like chemotaxis protein
MSSGRRKILIADDDVDDLEFLMDAITRIDATAEIDTVANGVQVLQYLSGCDLSNLPGLIILDYKMPFLNGAEVLEEMKTRGLYGDIPKIIWSTSNDNDLIKRCTIAGAVNYFPKPTKASDLMAMARRMLDAGQLS